MKKMCKRLLMFVLMLALCLECTVPVMAESSFLTRGGVENTFAYGMQPIDLSEEAIADARVSKDEMMEKYELSSKDFAKAEDEMQEQLGMKAAQTETVSANGISANSTEVSAERATYATLEDAADYLKEKMTKRADLVSLRVAGSKDTALKNATNIFNKACEYDINGEPDEGDYLRWHWRSYGWDYEEIGGGVLQIYISLEYLTSLEEEKYVTKRVNQIVSSLNLKSSSLNDYEKIRAIYDYVMSIITYDYYHYETNPGYDYMYTAYAALADGSAVCQAYSTLFYRLCEESGISARVICGNDDRSGNPTHGWNIVKIGKSYYNVDATWDDGDVPTHIYFLKNMADFTGHQRNRINDGAAFDKEFPTAPVSYLQPEEDPVKKLVSLPNITGSLTLGDGTQVSLSAAGKMKILLFINPAADSSVACVEEFYAQNSVKSGANDTIIADIYDKYAYQNVTPEDIMMQIIEMAQNPTYHKFSSDVDRARQYLVQYAAQAGYNGSISTSVVVIDASNRVRYFGTGLDGVSSIDDVVAALQPKPTTVVNGVAAKQTKNNAVKISWNSYGANQTYRIYRSVNGGKYYCVGTTTKTAFTDEVGPKKTYTYQIFAVRNGLDIAGSTQVSVKTKTILPKKGKTYTVDGYKYKVLKSTSKTKTVAFKGVSNKKLAKIIIPATVKIDGITYKVTEIAAKALNGNKKVKTVSIGSNVTKIGSKAFYKNSKLANIVIKSKKLKSVGSKALSGISGKAEIRVPSSKYKAYKKIFKGKGQKSSVKIKK